MHWSLGVWVAGAPGLLQGSLSDPELTVNTAHYDQSVGLRGHVGVQEDLGSFIFSLKSRVEGQGCGLVGEVLAWHTQSPGFDPQYCVNG